MTDSTRARIQNLPRTFSRASAYAANEPKTSDSSVVVSATIAELRSAVVKSSFWKIDS